MNQQKIHKQENDLFWRGRERESNRDLHIMIIFQTALANIVIILRYSLILFQFIHFHNLVVVVGCVLRYRNLKKKTVET